MLIAIWNVERLRRPPHRPIKNAPVCLSYRCILITVLFLAARFVENCNHNGNNRHNDENTAFSQKSPRMFYHTGDCCTALFLIARFVENRNYNGNNRHNNENAAFSQKSPRMFYHTGDCCTALFLIARFVENRNHNGNNRHNDENAEHTLPQNGKALCKQRNVHKWISFLLPLACDEV